MSDELKEALLGFFLEYGHKCAPYDWSFSESDACKRLVDVLKEELQSSELDAQRKALRGEDE